MKLLPENFIEIGDNFFEAQPTNGSCQGCAFITENWECTQIAAPCFASQRSDRRHVIFVQVFNKVS